MTVIDPDLATELRELLDKQAINEVLTRYLRAVDRGDVEGLRACYHDDATEDHGGVFEGTAADYVDSVADAITYRHALTSHILSNVLIEVDGDTATSESYATTFTRIWTGTETADAFIGARILDRHERRNGRWAISHRQLLWEWNHDMATSEGWVYGMLPIDDLIHGQKHPADPVYKGATQ